MPFGSGKPLTPLLPGVLTPPKLPPLRINVSFYQYLLNKLF
jgi:hypothetical protein